VQTFLPFPSLLASAVTLDDRRLGKQRVEAFQILRALVFPTYGWKHHPAVAMWRGFTPALVGYGLTICREWERRGYADAVAGALLEFTGGAVSDLGALRIEGRRRPGSAPRRCMHRIGRLLRKDPDYYGEMFPATLAVSAELPYDWPPPLFPRWPVRRTGRLAAAEALAAARLDHQPEADAVVAAAVARLREGNEVGVATAPRALATVLQLDPPALWLTHQPDVHLDAPPPYPPPAPRERPRGKLSPSIARPPSPADTAAMRQEPPRMSAWLSIRRSGLADQGVAARLAAQPPSVVVAPGALDGFVLRPDWRPVSPVALPASPRRTAGSPAGSIRHRPPRRRGTAGKS
jgi:hypothetical protein